MAFYEFQGLIPVVHQSAFVHPLAAVIGNVTIGANVYVGPGAALRGDWGAIEVRDGCNIQENCVLHAFPGVTVLLEEGAHIGHGAVIHGARIGPNALIGMNAVVMDHARVGAGAIVGALSLVREGTEVPERMIAAGTPARVIKPVTDEMMAWKSEGTKLYQELPAQLMATLRECEPLRKRPESSRPQPRSYETWRERKRRDG